METAERLEELNFNLGVGLKQSYQSNAADLKDPKELEKAAGIDRAIGPNEFDGDFLNKRECFTLTQNLISEFQDELKDNIVVTLTNILNSSDEELIQLIFQLLRDAIILRLLKLKLRDLYLFSFYAQNSLNHTLQKRLNKAFSNKVGIDSKSTHAFYEFCKATFEESGKFEELIQAYQDEFRLIFENVPVEQLAKLLSIFNSTFVSHLIASMQTLSMNSSWMSYVVQGVTEEEVLGKTGFAYTGLTLIQKGLQEAGIAKGLKLYHVKKVRQIFELIDISPIIRIYLIEYFKEKIIVKGPRLNDSRIMLNNILNEHPLNDNRKIFEVLFR